MAIFASGRAGYLVCIAAVMSASSTTVFAQRTPPLVGTVSPNAIGPAAPTAVPIGGLRTRPLTAGSAFRTDIALGRRGQFPLTVADAPLSHGGVLTNPTDAVSHAGAAALTWLPTAERPRWIRDPRVTPVQAWRDLIVTDVVCNGSGTCIERRQAIRARWISGCRCYAFADGWNRVWRVE